MASNPPAPTSKMCGVCGHVDPIPPGIDATNVRCVNVEAMWHAAYGEILMRCLTSMAQMESHVVSVQRDMAGIKATAVGVREDAERIAKALGD